MAERRKISFLQGPPSIFWRELAGAFEQAGHATCKITVSAGDDLYWRRPGAIRYRGHFANWKAYLTKFVRTHGVTDILYYADRQPYHVVAADVARESGITTAVLENGYLRPDWLTLERGGMSAYSHFPDSPSDILAIAAAAAEPDCEIRYQHGFATEAWHEVAYSLTSYFFWWLYPFYRADRYYSPVWGYLSHLLRLIRQGGRERAASARVREIVAGRKPFFLVPLQLQNDYQIRANSAYRGLEPFIDDVMSSFASHAPRDSSLLFKVHPMDNGWENWMAVVRLAASRHEIAGRVWTIDGGDLTALLAAAQGCVTVNSTVGLHAIRARCPTKVMGAALFNIPGLIHGKPLGAFWNKPDPVDADLADAFVRAIAATIQVKGSFYDRAGRKAAIDQIVRRITEQRVNQPGGFVPVPPRLGRAPMTVLSARSLA